MTYRYHSKSIKPGDTFIVLPGADGYIEDALHRGAKQVLPMSRQEMGEWAKQYYDDPSQFLKVVGVTGTNGKTSVCAFTAQMLEAAGYKPLLIGTLTHSLTTPESLDLQEMMAAHLKNGGTHVVMEVSSHGIAQHRVSGINFTVKLLTNITQDHLDFHGTFEAYRDTKLGFMAEGNAIKLYPENYESKPLNMAESFPAFMIKNAQAAQEISLALGLNQSDIYRALSTLVFPAGRFENINEGQPFMAIVDYAHTPDALSTVLIDARKHANSGRLAVMFGCGGDRDHGKRPIMGEIAARLADSVLVTTDNSRSENPETIIKEIVAGIPKDRRAHINIILDRRLAIEEMIEKARDGDVLVFAGKGHEKTQIDSRGSQVFDERSILRQALKKWKKDTVHGH